MQVCQDKEHKTLLYTCIQSHLVRTVNVFITILKNPFSHPGVGFERHRCCNPQGVVKVDDMQVCQNKKHSTLLYTCNTFTIVWNRKHHLQYYQCTQVTCRRNHNLCVYVCMCELCVCVCCQTTKTSHTTHKQAKPTFLSTTKHMTFFFISKTNVCFAFRHQVTTL